MPHLNKAMIIGYLGRDPEVRYKKNNTPIANMTVAVTEKRKSGEEYKEFTEWFRVTLFGNQAERYIGRYAKKGNAIYVEGRMQTRKWTDREGKERQSQEIVAEEVQLLGGRSNDRAERPQMPQRQESRQGQEKPVQQDLDDDIPF